MTKAAPRPQPPAASEPVSPMQMLGFALQNPNFNPVALEKLMDLADRWERDRARRAFVTARAKAKAEIGVIQKNKSVKYKGKDGKPDTNFEYAGLDDMYREVVPVLAKYGLSHSYRSSQSGERVCITCVLSHEDGYSEDASELCASDDKSGGKNPIQAMVSAATYLQRVTLALALGLAAGKDDDGKNAGVQAFLTGNQHAAITELMAATGTDRDDARFLTYLKEKFAVDAIDSLSHKQADTVIKTLRQKRANQ